MVRIYQVFALLLVMSVVLSSCNRRPASTADVPRHLPQSYKISVAPFTQPLNGGQLITGRVPEMQGQIPLDELNTLDMELRGVLMTMTKRQYDFIPVGELREELAMAPSTGQPSALPLWLNYAIRHKAEYLLVPMVLDWHEREGSEAGVEKSAHVRLEMFLLNVKNGQVLDRAVYEEKQVGLVDNLLGVKDFVRRKGQWITSRQLAKEGMEATIKELGL